MEQQSGSPSEFSEPLPQYRAAVAGTHESIDSGDGLVAVGFGAGGGEIMPLSTSSQWLESQARQSSTMTESIRNAQPIAELKSGTLRTLADSLLKHFSEQNPPKEDRTVAKCYLLAHPWFFKTHMLIEQVTRPVWESSMTRSISPSSGTGGDSVDSAIGRPRLNSDSGASITISIDSPDAVDADKRLENGLVLAGGGGGGGGDRKDESDASSAADPSRACHGGELSSEEASIRLMCYWRSIAPHHFDDTEEDVTEILDRLCQCSPVFSRRFNSKDDFSHPECSEGSVTAKVSDDAQEEVEDQEQEQLYHRRRGDSGSGRNSIALNQMNEMQIAEHIATLDFQFFSEVPDSEALLYAKKARSSATTTPTLQKAISFFNGCTQYITSMVLQGHNSVTRAKAFSRFVHVAKALRTLRCYNSVMAAVGALKYGSSITRLSQTMALIPHSDLKDLDELADLLRATGNYVALRKEVNAKPDRFTLPVIGIVLKDLVAVDSAMPNKVGEEPDRSFNFAKLQHFGLLLDSLHRWQSIPPNIEVDEELLKVLQLSFQPHYTEKDLYELSLDREPKTSKEAKEPQNVIPFQVWTQSSSVQVDRSTMDAYIEAMVDSVFKRYDIDKSGSISMEEFESIRSNFVFLENFQTLDANQDGVLSREEMLAYFKKVNFMRALRESFVHDFVETTFFSPAYCAHCKGLLWGLVKQGLRCKSCCINCHRHCQDRIVIDCHRFDTGTLTKKPQGAGSGGASGNGAVATGNNHTGTKRHPQLTTRRSTIQLVSDLQQGLTSGKITQDEVTTRVHDLMMENEHLQKKVHELQRRLDQRESQMSLVRQRTIAFVLEHLDNLNASRESSL
ncbi:RAS guanyl-releasing protein 2-like [Sycon ciliatum]|uniref:RAS guanyl-releasing protein 2-like n=1 Tax=Sycon ciliatum TaxID=27933 RepID=UPI0031F677D8